MKLNTFCGHLVHLLNTPMSEFTELSRALKEQSVHFDPEGDLHKENRRRAEANGVGFDPEILRGRAGPGGGIEADSFRTAFFLLAVALNGPRKEAARATWKTWHLSQEGSVLSGMGEDFEPTFTLCPLTGMHLFGEALRKIVDDPDLASRVRQIRAAAFLSAEIHFDDGKVSTFTKPEGRATPRLYRLAIVDGSLWQATAQLLQQEQ